MLFMVAMNRNEQGTKERSLSPVHAEVVRMLILNSVQYSNTMLSRKPLYEHNIYDNLPQFSDIKFVD